MASRTPIHPVMIVNQTGIDYIVKYKNEWIDGRSRCVSRKTVGKLVGKNVIFGKKFLSENPQYQDTHAIYENNTIVFVDEDPEVLQFIKLAQKCRMLEAGATYVLNQIAIDSGLADDLQAVFPDSYQEILSLALFFILQPESSVCSFDTFSTKTWLPTDKKLEASTITRLFQGISDTARFEYMRRRAAHSKALSDHAYWAFDTTSISSFSQTIRKARFGYNKEEDSLPQVNIALLIDEISGEPIYYKTLDGSLNDSVLLRNLFMELVQLDLESIHVVMDRGFCSLANLQTMYREDIGFIVGAKRRLELIQAAMQRIKPQLKLCIPRSYHSEIESYCLTESIPWIVSTRTGGKEEKPLYVHIYYSKTKEAQDIQNATHVIQRFETLLSEKNKAIDDRLFRRFFKCSHNHWEVDDLAWVQFCDTAGFTVLLSNQVQDPVLAMQIYRQRDVVEKAFCNFKDRCSGRRFQCEEAALEGKVFVLYIALSLLLMLKKRLSNEKLPCDSTPKYLDQLGAIQLCRIDGTKKRYWQELSKKDRDLIRMAKVTLPKSII